MQTEAAIVELSRKHPLYGYRRVHAMVLRGGLSCARRTVQRVRRREGLRVLGPARRPRCPARPYAKAPAEEPEETMPPPFERGEVTELPLFLPPGFTARGPEFAQFIDGLSACSEPVAFELFGTAASVTAQLAVAAEDVPHARAQLRAYFPELASAPILGGLARAWEASGEWAGAAEFGLAHEPMLPLASFGGDICVPLVCALAELHPQECGVFQVLF